MDFSRMHEIDPDFLCHRLTVDNRVRPVVQRRRKFNKERRLVIKTESQNLLNVGHIREILYPKWMANVVFVRKINDKWRMCVDFTDLVEDGCCSFKSLCLMKNCVFCFEDCICIWIVLCIGYSLFKVRFLPCDPPLNRYQDDKIKHNVF